MVNGQQGAPTPFYNSRLEEGVSRSGRGGVAVWGQVEQSGDSGEKIPQPCITLGGVCVCVCVCLCVCVYVCVLECPCVCVCE